MACGRINSLLKEVFKRRSQYLLLLPLIATLSPEGRASMLREFGRARRHLQMPSSLEFGYWPPLPWEAGGSLVNMFGHSMRRRFVELFLPLGHRHHVQRHPMCADQLYVETPPPPFLACRGRHIPMACTSTCGHWGYRLARAAECSLDTLEFEGVVPDVLGATRAAHRGGHLHVLFAISGDRLLWTSGLVCRVSCADVGEAIRSPTRCYSTLAT